MVRLAIFIDASGRLEKEDPESMKMDIEDADIVITNNGTLEEFYDKLDRLYAMLKTA
jgi:dephospho-CoA kinase